jgi:FkbM family methyltransferase
VSGFPITDYVLRAGGRLPPALRSSISTRILAAIARRHQERSALVPTNYGIVRRLRCRVPPSQIHARFGKPTLYAGERGALEVARALSGNADVFVDIGAHLGFFTLYVRQCGSPTLPIHFFEPDPDLFRLLQANVHANGLPAIEGHQVAIGAVNGVARFYVNRTDSFSGSLTEKFAGIHDVSPIDVHVRSFADVSHELAIANACVKVDVEHAEFEFLAGALGAFDRIRYLIIEILAAAHARNFVSELMAQAGFNAFYINDYVLQPSADGTFEYREPEYNWLFCRERADELALLLRGSRLRVDVSGR